MDPTRYTGATFATNLSPLTPTTHEEVRSESVSDEKINKKPFPLKIKSRWSLLSKGKNEAALWKAKYEKLEMEDNILKQMNVELSQRISLLTEENKELAKNNSQLEALHLESWTTYDRTLNKKEELETEVSRLSSKVTSVLTENAELRAQVKELETALTGNLALPPPPLRSQPPNR